MSRAASKIISPAYVFSEDGFCRRAREVSETFGGSIGLCYSIKANPFLLHMLPEQFSRIEVCSPGELSICEQLGTDMKRIVFSGVNKTQSEIVRAISDGVGILTAESPLQYDMICGCGREADVLLRLSSGNQFGMDEGDIFRIIKERRQHPHIRVAGIHYFSGTMKKKPAKIIKELAYLEDFLDRLKQETGYYPAELEYGTGLAVDYFSEDADSLETARLEEISPALNEMASRLSLTVEMGRFFAAPCGYYFSKVAETKTNKGISYAIIDGGIHQLKYDGQLQGMQIPVIDRLPAAALDADGSLPAETAASLLQSAVPAEKHSPGGRWTLCGSLCTVADVIAHEAPFERLEAGDMLVFHRTGAYSVYEGMSAFLSRDMPRVYLLRADGRLESVRDRIETYSFNY